MNNDAIRGVVDSPYSPMGGAAGPSDDSLGKDAFLRLLITQLSNQDPLSPTDPTQFVSQLAQFTSLEQLVGVNEGLDVIAITQAAATSAQMVSFIGQDIWIDDSTFVLEAGESETLNFSLEGDASEVTVQIKDSEGELVRTIELGAEGAGDVVVEFDGKDDDGNPLPDGTYSFGVTAKDADGDPVDAATKSLGHVAGVTFEAGYPQLVLADGREIALGQVLEVSSPSPDTPPSDDGDEAGSEGDTESAEGAAS